MFNYDNKKYQYRTRAWRKHNMFVNIYETLKKIISTTVLDESKVYYEYRYLLSVRHKLQNNHGRKDTRGVDRWWWMKRTWMMRFKNDIDCAGGIERCCRRRRQRRTVRR